MKNEGQAKITLVLSMFIFGTIGIFRKYIDLPSGTIAMARGLIGMLFLGLIMIITNNKISSQSLSGNKLKLFLSGVFIGVNWILLFESYNYTTVATATLCYYMAPVIVMLVSPFMFNEKLTARKIICVICSVIGMVFVSGILKNEQKGSSDFIGIILGLSATVLYAAVVLINKKLETVDAFNKTFIQLGTAGVILIPYCFFAEGLTTINTSLFSIIMVVIVGIVHTGIAYALYFGAIGKLKAQTTAILSYIDPVVAILLSVIILRESIDIYSVIGAILILGSSIISERKPTLNN